MNNYHFLLILVLVFGFYFFSFYLSKIKKISLITHRRFWNIVLLITFLISGIIGLILALFIDLKLSIYWYRIIIWLHVETGIIMALISICHIFWHLPYFKKLYIKPKIN
ncbi:MAG: hypothetical protein PHN66_01695 [Candidatus Shapirobacteria bacterium]|nr:hypothetical protein [Candidatus Shapirobacteria bacterium]